MRGVVLALLLAGCHHDSRTSGDAPALDVAFPSLLLDFTDGQPEARGAAHMLRDYFACTNMGCWVYSPSMLCTSFLASLPATCAAPVDDFVACAEAQCPLPEASCTAFEACGTRFWAKTDCP